MAQGLLAGKRFLIAGIASKLSIAFGIAQALHREGAELAFTYPNDKLKKRVDDFAEQFGSTLVFPCDVAVDAEIDLSQAPIPVDRPRKSPPKRAVATSAVPARRWRA